MEATILPFLQPQRIGAVLIAKHKLATGGQAAEVESEEGEPHPGVMQAMENLIKAVHMKDAKAASEAFMDAWQIADSQEDQGEEANEQEGE